MPAKKTNRLFRFVTYLLGVLINTLIGDHLFRLWAYQANVPQVPGEVPYIIVVISALVYLALVLVIRRMTRKRLSA